ncbi:hypothetical protein ACO0OL_004229 [Hanseniaspora opuntiae]|jgi:hypothetical protein|uniref:Uncharacterized protein n=1 Tax=Hanseniaspora opuntiae TaxID=211096 RepID=A0A1E5RLS5_9ASCO|nr:hypothetical protein AWRI3578_g1455 [Hanseniaspora opuntiae]
MFHLKPSTINITAQEVDEIKSLTLSQLKHQLKTHTNTHIPNDNKINALNLTSYLSDNEEDLKDINTNAEYDQMENNAISPLLPKTKENQ